VPPPPIPAPLPPAPDPNASAGTKPNLRVQWAHWMESHLGRAYVPVTMAAGALIGGTAGALALGPIGGIAGAIGGAVFLGALVFAG